MRALTVVLCCAGLAADIAATARATDYETVEINAPRLGGMTVGFNLILPRDYSAPSSARCRYPVLYLLHGYTDHYPAWVSYTRLLEYARGYEEIIVMPEGNNSFYTNSQADPKLAWEDFLVRDLIPYVDGRYRTLASREGRAIAGLSMGGYGAMKLGLKYPDLFTAVASLSGALGSARNDWLPTRPEPQLREVLESAFGPPDSPAHALNDPFELAKTVAPGKLPQLYISIGADDFLLEDNRKFARLLSELKVPYQYREVPGKHEWSVWDREIQAVLEIQAATLRPSCDEGRP